MAGPIPNSKSPLISGQLYSSGQTTNKNSKKDVFSGLDESGDNKIKKICADIINCYENLGPEMERSSLSHLRELQDNKKIDKALKSYNSIDHPLIKEMCNTLQNNTMPKLKKKVSSLINQKVAEEQEDLSSLDCEQLKDKKDAVDRDNKNFFENLFEAKTEENEENEKKKLIDLNYKELSNTMPSLDGNVKSFAKNLLDKMKEDVQHEECNCEENGSKDEKQECNCNEGGSEDGMKVCNHEEAANGRGSTHGSEEPNDTELQCAHEEAACDCEKISQEKGDDIKSATKSGVKNSWKKIAEYIRGNATKALWKNFSGGVLGTCRSDGKTCYSTKLRGNTAKLKEVIVHECRHDQEFSVLGTSDETDTYNMHKEYSKLVKEVGPSKGKKPTGGDASGDGGASVSEKENPLNSLIMLLGLGCLFKAQAQAQS